MIGLKDQLTRPLVQGLLWSLAFAVVVYLPIIGGYFTIDDIAGLVNGTSERVVNHYLNGRFLSSVEMSLLNDLFGNYLELGGILRICHLLAYGALAGTVAIVVLFGAPGRAAKAAPSRLELGLFVITVISILLYPIYVDLFTFLTGSYARIIGSILLILVVQVSLKRSYVWLFPLALAGATSYQLYFIYSFIIPIVITLIRVIDGENAWAMTKDGLAILFWIVLAGASYLLLFKILLTPDIEALFGMHGTANSMMAVTSIPMHRLKLFFLYLWSHYGSVDHNSPFFVYGPLVRLPFILLPLSLILFFFDRLTYLRIALRDGDGSIMRTCFWPLLSASLLVAMSVVMLGNILSILFNSWYGEWRPISLSGLLLTTTLLVLLTRSRIRLTRVLLTILLTTYCVANVAATSKLVFYLKNWQQFEFGLASRIVGELDSRLTSGQTVQIVGSLSHPHGASFMQSPQGSFYGGGLSPKLSTPWSKKAYLDYVAGHMYKWAKGGSRDACRNSVNVSSHYRIVWTESGAILCLY